VIVTLISSHEDGWQIRSKDFGWRIASRFIAEPASESGRYKERIQEGEARTGAAGCAATNEGCGPVKAFGTQTARLRPGTRSSQETGARNEGNGEKQVPRCARDDNFLAGRVCVGPEGFIPKSSKARLNYAADVLAVVAPAFTERAVEGFGEEAGDEVSGCGCDENCGDEE
jgi:hypothetical protein